MKDSTNAIPNVDLLPTSTVISTSVSSAHHLSATSSLEDALRLTPTVVPITTLEGSSTESSKPVPHLSSVVASLTSEVLSQLHNSKIILYLQQLLCMHALNNAAQTTKLLLLYISIQHRCFLNREKIT